MTTETPSPLHAFRVSRDAFLHAAVTGAAGLEEAVLEFERDHIRRTTEAEGIAAALREENRRLTAELGEKENLLNDAQAPADAADPAELVEARKTIEKLRRDLADRDREAEAAEEDGDDVEALRADLAEARRTISSQQETLDGEARLRERLEEEARGRRRSYDESLSKAAEEKDSLAERARKAEAALHEQADSIRAAARSEALGLIRAVAQDSPDTPLEEALDMVAIAMNGTSDSPGTPADDIAGTVTAAMNVMPDEVLIGATAPAAESEHPDPAPDAETQHPTAAAPEEPEADFFATLAPPVVPAQEEEVIFGAVPDDDAGEADDGEDGLEPQVMFDIDTALDKTPEAEPVPAAPKPGFGLFRKSA
ncbi:hypothetical protein [Arthrobacter sp. IK3]|uniref:hypothetical protein n=1 Tax=Arthrobacter sp. IK3 TaxID=3448169 RepID=UPI003EE356EF